MNTLSLHNVERVTLRHVRLRYCVNTEIVIIDDEGEHMEISLYSADKLTFEVIE